MAENSVYKNDTVVVNNRKVRHAALSFRTTIILLSVFFFLMVSFSFLIPACGRNKFVSHFSWYGNRIRTNDSQKLIAAKKNLYQTDPILIDELRGLIMQPASCIGMYDLKNPNVVDPSNGAARIARILTNYKTNGFFVEYRAGDGERLSDTLFLERFLGWTGLLIETDPLNVDSIQRIGRQTWIAPTCLSLNTTAYLTNVYPFGAVLDRIIGMTFGLGYFDDGSMGVNQVACYPLYSHIAAMNRTQVDYFSLDAEGEELRILLSVPFELLDISVLSVKYSRTSSSLVGIRNLLEGKHYRIVSEIAPNYLVLAKRGLRLATLE